MHHWTRNTGMDKGVYMNKVVLHTMVLGTLVRISPQGKIYKVVVSSKHPFRPALYDPIRGRTREMSPVAEVYYVCGPR